jgi:hypothetical protein
LAIGEGFFGCFIKKVIGSLPVLFEGIPKFQVGSGLGMLMQFPRIGSIALVALFWMEIKEPQTVSIGDLRLKHVIFHPSQLDPYPNPLLSNP